MNNQSLSTDFVETVKLDVPAFLERPVISLDLSRIKNGESRLVEAKVVTPATYSELEYTFNEGFREAHKALSVIGYEITRAEKRIRQVKSEIILDEYPEFIKERKLNDNTSNREAFLEKQSSYVEAIDRLNMLKAIESFLNGKIKIFENVCRYMKKEMDLRIRSGNSNKY